METQIKETAESVIGYQGKSKRNDWFDEECQQTLDKKNEARKQLIERPTRKKRDNYI